MLNKPFNPSDFATKSPSFNNELNNIETKSYIKPQDAFAQILLSQRPPSATQNLTAKVLPPFEIALNWNPPLDLGGANITGYRIERSENGGPFSLVVYISGPITSYADDFLKPATKYSYRVFASNGAYLSNSSSIVNATIPHLSSIVYVMPFSSIVLYRTSITYSVLIEGDGNVGSPIPTGTVYFRDNGAGGKFSSDTCTLSNARCSVSFTTPFSAETISITWVYSGDAAYAPDKESTGITVAGPPGYYLSPKVQLKLGITPTDVICAEGFTLMERTVGGPVCASNSDVERLNRTGFAHTIISRPLITEAEAIGLLASKFQPYKADIQNSSIGYLQFNSTQDHFARFKIFEISPKAFSSVNGQGKDIVLYCSPNFYCNSSQIANASNKFVRILWGPGGFPRGPSFFFVDAVSGEYLGDYNACPKCICLSGQTTIDTPVGPVDLKDIKVGVKVWTADKHGHKEEATILKTSMVPVPSAHALLQITLYDGRHLIASPRHPTADGNLIASLRVGDWLDGSRISRIELVLVDEGFTYDALPSGDTGYYWANGILVGSTLK